MKKCEEFPPSHPLPEFKVITTHYGHSSMYNSMFVLKDLLIVEECIALVKKLGLHPGKCSSSSGKCSG